MEWLNYHHLLYFWMVAREGSISRACEQLHLAQPTISNQIRKLEKALGAKLFEKSGRKLVLTETGQLVYRYAEEIFSIGRELMTVVRGRSPGQALPFIVGVPDVLPKLMVYRLLQPALTLGTPLRLVCREGGFSELLGELATHSLDVVLSDRPVGPEVRVRAYNHALGRTGVALFAAPSLAKKYRQRFPECLAEAPILLPAAPSSLRRQLDEFFEQRGLQPPIVGEFQDSALMKAFGQQGMGLFPGSLATTQEIQRQYGVVMVGELPGVQERFYAISVERKLKHPAIIAIAESARAELLKE